MTGFHFTGTAVHALPELRFPFFRIPGSLGLEYSPSCANAQNMVSNLGEMKLAITDS